MFIEIIIVWLFLCLLVGIGAGRRGRTGFGWFVLAFIFSPLLMGLLLLALGPANGSAQPAGTGFWSAPTADQLAAKRRSRQQFFGGSHSSTPGRAVRSQGPFEPEGVLGGIPYRVRSDGAIDALVDGAEVRFKDVENLRAVAERNSTA